MRRAHRAFDRALQARLAPHGISTAHWYYLRVLWEEGGLGQRELSERVNVAENTTTAMIAAMAADGLVVRTRDPADRRRRIVTLTPKGEALRALLPCAEEVNAAAGAGLSGAELDAFFAVLERMTANLAGPAADAQPEA